MTPKSQLKNICIAAALLFAAHPAWANQILAMADEADTIVIGEGVAPAFNADVPIEFSVCADSVLKGEAQAGFKLKAVYPKPNCCMTGQIDFEKLAPSSGSYGLWLFNGAVASLVRLPKSWVAPRGASLEKLLLVAVVESYRQSISDADLVNSGEPSYAKRRLRNSLQYAGRFGEQDTALKVLEELRDSASGEELQIALAAGIGMSQDSALVRLGAELGSLRLDGDILSALENSYMPQHGTAQLENLIRQNRNARVIGLDSALAGALRRVPGKARLPLAALLLDSPDEQAVRRAAGHFYEYTVLARDGGEHPYKNAETQAHNGHDESMPASAHAAFWRGWWADHQRSMTPLGN